MLSLIVALVAALLLLVLVARLRKLSASERLHRTIVHSLPAVTIVLIDRDRRIRLVAGAEHGLAYALLDELAEPVAAALRGDGAQLLWQGRFSVLLGPFEEPGRGVTHAICVVRDISARLDATRELEQQRSFLTSLLGQLSDRVYACDANGRLLRFGDDAPGVDPSLHPLEWAGALGMMHGDGTPMGPHEAPLLRALRGERIDGVEMLVDGPEGRLALLCSGGPVKAADGRLLGAVVTATDLTGRRETEELLRASEERHRRVVESMTDCVFETDVQGRWTFLNAAWTRATGYEVGESIGRRATEFVHPEDRARHQRTFEPLLRGEHSSARLAHRFVTADGAVRWVDARVSTIPGWDGLPTGFMGVMRDVTDERRADQHAAAEQAVVRLLAGARSLEDAAPALLEALCNDLEWDVAELWRMGDDECLHRTAWWGAGAVDARVFEVGDGLSGQAWMSREPLWRADEGGFSSAVALPLRADDETVGVVQLFSRVRRDPEPGLIRPFQTIGAHIGQFMQRRDAERRAAERAADLTTISGVAHSLAAQNDMYAARTTLVHAVREVSGATCVVLWERAAGGEALEVTAADGAAVRGMTLPLDGSTLTADVFNGGELAFVPDLAEDPRISLRWREITGAGSSAWVPVAGDGRVHGVLAVGWPAVRDALPAREAELLRLLAAEAAVTIHRTALLGTLQATARTDPLTGLPNRRVWDEDVARELARAAPPRRHAVPGDARPRSLQGVQRPPRPSGRRSPACRRGRGVAAGAAGDRHARPLRR